MSGWKYRGYTNFYLTRYLNNLAILGEEDLDGAIVGILLAILLGIIVTFLIVASVWR